jgi:hypothetical protein
MNKKLRKHLKELEAGKQEYIETTETASLISESVERMRLINEMLVDLTGHEEYDVKRAPYYIHELAEHLIDAGWKRK